MYFINRFVRLDRFWPFKEDGPVLDEQSVLLLLLDKCVILLPITLSLLGGSPCSSHDGMDGGCSAVGENISSMRSPNSQNICGQEKSADVRCDLRGILTVVTARP